MGPAVLLFRAPTESDSKKSDSYEDFLRQHGIIAQSLAVLQFNFVNINKLAEKLSQPDAYAGLVFTSPRSVEAVHQCLQQPQVNIAAWSRHSNYVVGEATGQLVEQKLQLSTKGQESGNAAALAQYIISDDLNRSKPLLFPSADIRRDTLPTALETAGVKLDSIIVYETEIRRDLTDIVQSALDTAIPKPEALVFFSPSGVAGVIDALNKLCISVTEFKLFAIGPSTEAALKSSGLEIAGTASKPNVQCLYDALQNAGIRGENV